MQHPTNPQHRALAIAAADPNGRITRGGKPDQAPVSVLEALARRGFLHLTPYPGPRRANWAHGTITRAGRTELTRLDAAAAEQARREANARPARTSTIAGADPFAVCRDATADAFDRIDAALAGN